MAATATTATAAKPADRTATAPARTGSGARWALALLSGAGFAWLAWQVARVDAGLGAPLSPTRALAAIEANANAGKYPDAAQARAGAQRVLHDRPVEGAAYRVLADLQAQAGHDAAATKLFAIAAARWPRERQARAQLAARALRRGDIDTALTHYDALLRVAPGARTRLLATLMPLLDEARVRDGLVKRLAIDPPWRAALPGVLRADTTDPRAAEALLAQLAGRLAPSDAELQTRLALLEKFGQAAQARRIWLATVDATGAGRAGSVGTAIFDGGFEHPGISGGYGWRLDAPAGTSIGHDTSDAVQGDQALVIAFEGRATAFAGVRQRLALATGRHRFAYRSRNQTETVRPFAWRIACTDAVRTLLESGVPAEPGWQTTTAEFDVPADCPRQELELRHLGRSLAERRVSGLLYLDDLGIIPRP